MTLDSGRDEGSATQPRVKDSAGLNEDKRQVGDGVSNSVEIGIPNPVDHPENMADLGQGVETVPGPSVEDVSIVLASRGGRKKDTLSKFADHVSDIRED